MTRSRRNTTRERSGERRSSGPFRTLVGIRFPRQEKEIQRIARGDRVPARDNRYVPAGEIVEELPAAIVPGLLAAGHIEPVSSSPMLALPEEEKEEGGDPE